MRQDMTVPCGDGFINVRAGAIIMKDGKFLMVGDGEDPEYLYSVGGRLRFGETAEEAVVREVYEETGVRMEVDRLGFVHEDYFIGDMPQTPGTIYEIAFYFYMKMPDGFEPVRSFTEDAQRVYLRWVAPDDEIRFYPTFFRTELAHPQNTVKHIATDERRKGTEA